MTSFRVYNIDGLVEQSDFNIYFYSIMLCRIDNSNYILKRHSTLFYTLCLLRVHTYLRGLKTARTMDWVFQRSSMLLIADRSTAA